METENKKQSIVKVLGKALIKVIRILLGLPIKPMSNNKKENV